MNKVNRDFFRITKIIINKTLLIIAVSFFIGASFSSLGLSLGWCEDYGDAYVSGSLSDATILIPFLADDSASGGICNFSL